MNVYALLPNALLATHNSRVPFLVNSETWVLTQPLLRASLLLQSHLLLYLGYDGLLIYFKYLNIILGIGLVESYDCLPVLSFNCITSFLDSECWCPLIQVITDNRRLLLCFLGLSCELRMVSMRESRLRLIVVVHHRQRGSRIIEHTYQQILIWRGAWDLIWR